MADNGQETPKEAPQSGRQPTEVVEHHNYHYLGGKGWLWVALAFAFGALLVGLAAWLSWPSTTANQPIQPHQVIVTHKVESTETKAKAQLLVETKALLEQSQLLIDKLADW